MRFVIFCSCLFSFSGFSQVKKTVPAVYKTLSAQTFSVGDRFAMGGLETARVPGKYQKYTVTVNDSLYKFRDFMFAHPNMEFRVHVLWKQLGRKFPSETKATTDTLVKYFRKPLASDDNKNYANEVKHAYFKQSAYVKLELEIIVIKPENGVGDYAFVRSVLAFPDPLTVYENYANTVDFGVAGLPDNEALWVESSDATIRYVKRGQVSIRPHRGVGEVVLNVRSGTAEHPVDHGKYRLRAAKLPEPEIFLGPIKLEELVNAPDSVAFQYRDFYANYPPENLLSAVFTVAEVRYTIAGKKVSQRGKSISPKILKKIEATESGSEIIIREIIVNGTKRFRIKKGFRKVKSTPAGTHFRTTIT